MKVYELMNELAKLPSGTEVHFSHIISANDFDDMELLDKEGENEIRSLTAIITSVNYISSDIYLYGETR